jgi:hypothetical protein
MLCTYACPNARRRLLTAEASDAGEERRQCGIGFRLNIDRPAKSSVERESERQGERERGRSANRFVHCYNNYAQSGAAQPGLPSLIRHHHHRHHRVYRRLSPYLPTQVTRTNTAGLQHLTRSPHHRLRHAKMSQPTSPSAPLSRDLCGPYCCSTAWEACLSLA